MAFISMPVVHATASSSGYVTGVPSQAPRSFCALNRRVSLHSHTSQHRHTRTARLTVWSMQWQQEIAWNVVEVLENSIAATGIRSIVINVGSTEKGSLCEGYKTPGMFVQIKSHYDTAIKPAFFAIASAPGTHGKFEFIIKEAESTSWLWNLKQGDKVEMSPAMGKGFNMKELDLAGFAQEQKPMDIIMMATGTGVAPMRAAIESEAQGLHPSQRRSVKLFYGCRDASHMVFKDRLSSWKAANVQVIPVFSSKQPDAANGFEEYVADVHEKPVCGKYIQEVLQVHGVPNPKQTVALVIGQKNMFMEAKEILITAGVPESRILTNF